MANDPQCLFLEVSGAKPARCAKPRVAFSPFCEKHDKKFRHVENKELLDHFGACLKALLYPLDNGEVAIKHDDPLKFGEITNLFNELYHRGYTRKELGSYLFQPGEIGPLDELLKDLGTIPKWRRFEKLVEAIHRAQFDYATVQYDEKIRGRRSGRLRQADITVRIQHLYYSILIAIECKDHKNAIKAESVEAFRTKLDDIGADRGVMVASNDYQKGAVEVANAYGIDLFTLSEITADWRSVTRIFEQRIPFPTAISFLPPIKDHHLSQPTPADFGFDEILFEFTEPNTVRSLAEICVDVCEWAALENLSLPQQIDVYFERLVDVFLPDKNRVQAKGVSIKLTSYLHREKKQLDLPPQTVRYGYKDIVRNVEYMIYKDSNNS